VAIDSLVHILRRALESIPLAEYAEQHSEIDVHSAAEKAAETVETATAVGSPALL
jgi:hypothetical protein